MSAYRKAAHLWDKVDDGVVDNRVANACPFHTLRCDLLPEEVQGVMRALEAEKEHGKV